MKSKQTLKNNYQKYVEQAVQPSTSNKRVFLLFALIFVSAIFLFFVHDFLVLDERNSIHHQFYEDHLKKQREQQQQQDISLQRVDLKDIDPIAQKKQQFEKHDENSEATSTVPSATAATCETASSSLFGNRAQQQSPHPLLLKAQARSKRNSATVLRSYSRITGVDCIGSDLKFYHNATLVACLRHCDRHPQCNYVVRNMTFLNAERNAGPTPCWLKRAVVMNTYTNLHRETWVISKAPQPKIAIGVLSAPKFVDTRLAAAFSTWLRDEDCIVMLEKNYESKSKVNKMFGPIAARGDPAFNTRGAIGTRVLFLFEEEDKFSVPGAWKNLILLKQMPEAYVRMMHGVQLGDGDNSNKSSLPYKNLPDWYFVVDDDSFVIMRSLRFMLAVSLPSEAQFTGLLMSAKDYTSGSHFIQGGAGILLSDETMRRTYPKMNSCIDLCKQNFGDFRTGCCVVHAAQIVGTLHRGFYSYDAWQNTAKTTQRMLYGLPVFPVSFHRFRKVAMIVQFQKHINEYLSQFAEMAMEKRLNKYSGSRYQMFPTDRTYWTARNEVEDVNSGSMKVPYSRRVWAFVDDLISQKLMKNLRPVLEDSQLNKAPLIFVPNVGPVLNNQQPEIDEFAITTQKNRQEQQQQQQPVRTTPPFVSGDSNSTASTITRNVVATAISSSSSTNEPTIEDVNDLVVRKPEDENKPMDEDVGKLKLGDGVDDEFALFGVEKQKLD